MLVDTGRAAVNKIISGLQSPEALLFCLYTNTVTWSHSTVIGAITEAAWTLYVRQSVALGAWNPPAADATFDQVSVATIAAVFTNGTGSTQTANGFFVIGSSSGVLYGGAAFSTPLAIVASSNVSTFPQLITNAVPTSP